MDRDDFTSVLRVIRRARRRWRLRLLLRGLAAVLGTGLLVVGGAALAMDWFLFSDSAVRVARWTALLVIAATALRFLAVPLLRRASNRQIALYIEEHEPSLQSALLTAVEEEDVSSAERQSPLRRQLLEDVIRRCEEIELGARVERSRLRRVSTVFLTLAAAGFLAALFSPAFLQHGALLLLAPWRAEAADRPYHIEVAPGDATIARGADFRVRARLIGFASDDVSVVTLEENGGDWVRTPMSPADASEDFGDAESAADLEVILLGVDRPFEYFVESDGLRTPVHRVDVVEIPYVEQLDLELHFPAFTGLGVERIEDGGDIAALVGTRVRLDVTPTVPVTAGVLRLTGVEDEIPLEVGADGRLRAELVVADEAFYEVLLRDRRGDLHRASPEYVITPLEDQPPLLRVLEPGRDLRATKIEEIFVEVESEDDYGVRSLDLYLGVNGGEPQRLRLGRFGAAGASRTVTAAHTIFLEEMELADGDFLAYYAVARDHGARGRDQTSDIYFIEIRPFGQEYRRAEGGGAGGGGGGIESRLSAQQREIVAATFRLVRDGDDFEGKELAESLRAVALSQQRLRGQVLTLVERMRARGAMSGDDDFRQIIEHLEAAAPEMSAAEEQLQAESASRALAPEQRALTHLQRAEAVFRDVRVSFQQGQGGGGSQLSEDLADLFELELDKLRNQYEVVRRGQEQQAENEIDEVQQRLEELARRQQQENERRQRLAQSGAGGGAQGQEDLISETEELARRLERLAREQSRPELKQTAQRLRDAAREMKRASAGSRSREAAGGGSGLAAVDALKEARRLLDKNRELHLGEEMQDVESRMARTREMQERIADEVRRMSAAGGPGGSSQDEMGRLAERKAQLGSELESLEQQLDRMARQARSENAQAARALQGAANSIRSNQLKEKVRYSMGVVQQREGEVAERFEQEISRDVAELGEHVSKAAEAVSEGRGDGAERALESARKLVENLESLEERLRTGTEEGETRGPAEGAPEGQRSARGGEGEEPGGSQAESSGAGEERRRIDRVEENGTPGSEAGTEPGQGRRGREGTEGEGRGRGAAVAPRLGPSSGGSLQPGVFSQEQLRQAQREVAQRLRDGEALRERLGELGVRAPELDEALRALRRFDPRQIENEPRALDRLRAGVVEPLRDFEFKLWRQLDPQRDQRIRLSQEAAVPPGYEGRVEEYFRELARQP